jgi:hypothetical protein
VKLLLSVLKFAAVAIVAVVALAALTVASFAIPLLLADLLG